MKTRIKKTYICRQVDNWQLRTEIPEGYYPQVGDVGIFEVLHIGKHCNVQSDSKRNVNIIEGDHIMAAFGTRYATAQFEGYVPGHVNQELHILGAGGTIGVIESMHNKYEDIGPTKLRIVGLAVDQKGRLINTKKLMHQEIIPFSGVAASATKVILSLGSSMDSGKTTSAAYLAHGLKNAGMNVAYIKLTGTVYTKDADLAWDLGADVVADFGDYGFPSTYLCSEEELLSLYETLLANVLPFQPDYVIMEIADGLYQRETKMLLTSYKFISTIDKVIFSAGDSLAAINGVHLLNKWGIHPLFLSGLLTASPLLIKEVKENTHVPVFTIEELAEGNKVIALFTKSSAWASNQ
jgi:hypothetical protein